MKLTKQRLVARIIKTGKYKEVEGEIYHLRSSGWHNIKPNKLPTEYGQVRIFNGLRGKKGLNALVYVHQMVFMLHNGIYGENMVIDHIDRNRKNNRIENLRAVTNAMNKANSDRSCYSVRPVKPILKDDIFMIRALLQKGMSQAAIARTLDLNRLSTRYVIKKIQLGQTLMAEKR